MISPPHLLPDPPHLSPLPTPRLPSLSLQKTNRQTRRQKLQTETKFNKQEQRGKETHMYIQNL